MIMINKSSLLLQFLIDFFPSDYIFL